MTRLRITVNGGLPLAARSLGLSEAQALLLAHGSRQPLYVKCEDDPGYVLQLHPLDGVQHFRHGARIDPLSEWGTEWGRQLEVAINRALTFPIHHHNEGTTT